MRTGILIFLAIILLHHFNCKAQWQMVEGLDGGKTTGIANIDSILFVSTEYNGIFTNKSGSWELAHPDSTYNHVITAGKCALITGHPYYNNECFKSFDLGETWEAVPNFHGIYHIYNIDSVIFFRNNSLSDSILLRSFDYGDTYDTVLTPFQKWKGNIFCDDSLLFIHPESQSTISKIYFSGDLGNTWDSLNVDGLFSYSSVSFSHIRYINETFWTIKHVGAVPISYQKVFVFDPSYKKWIDVTGDSTNRQFYYDIIEFNNKVLCSHDLYSVLEFVEEDSSWVAFADGSKNVNQFLHLNSEMYCSTDQGPYSIDTNGNWTSHTIGLNHRNVTSLDTYNSNIYLTANNELFFSSNGGSDFEIMDEAYGKQIVTTDSVFYLLTTNKFLMSWNEGYSWQSFTEGIENIQYQRFSNFSITPKYYYLSTWEGLYRTSTNSINWVRLDNTPIAPDRDIAKVESTGNTVILGEAWPAKYMALSKDYGYSFNIFGPYCQFKKIDQSYYILRDSILYSDDEANSWKHIPYAYNHTLDDIYKINDTVIVIGYEFGGDFTLKITYNLGEQWTDIVDNLEVIPDVAPHYIKFVKIHEGRTFISSQNGLWYRDDLIVSIPDSQTSPKIAENIINIYPNPAGNYLHVDLNNLRASKITIKSSLGKTVLQQKAFHQNGVINLNISSLNQGIYYIILSNNKESQVRKLIKR